MIKGSGQDLYVGKKESNIITMFGGKRKIIYENLRHIDFSYAEFGETGYLIFVGNDIPKIRFEFFKKENAKIKQTIELIEESNPELVINEFKVEDLKFHQKWWFAILMMFCCCFPIGLFLMWYNKKFTYINRIFITIIFCILWSVGIYSSYINYTIKMSNARAAIEEYQNQLSNIQADIEGEYNTTQTTAESNEIAEEAEVKTHFNVGDVYEDDNVKIMFLDCGDYAVDNEYNQPDAGNKYIFADFSIQNISEDDCGTGYALFHCYADDTECKHAIISGEGDMTIVTTLSPGRNTKGKIYYQVPKDADKIEIEYKPDILADDKIYFDFNKE